MPKRARLTIAEFTAPAAAPAPLVPAVPPPAGVTQNADGTWPFTAVLCVEGSPTGDGRQFDAGALTWRELPVNLLFQPQTGEWGHAGSFNVGRIDTIERDGNLIRGAGVILPANPNDPDDPIGTLLTLLNNGVRVGPSVDLDDMVVDWQEPTIVEGDDFADDTDDLMRVTAGRIMAATVVATPAFAEVALQLGTDPVAARAATDPSSTAPAVDPAAAPVTTDAAAAAPAAPVDAPADAPVEDDTPTGVDRSDGVTISVGDDVIAVVDARPVPGTATAVDPDASTVDVTASDGTVSPAVPVDDVFPNPDADATPAAVAASAAKRAAPARLASAPALIAAAGPTLPPASWFADPAFGETSADDPRLAEIMEPDPLRPGQLRGTGQYGAPIFIADDGRLFGHIATWGTCHTGFADTCVTPPPSPSDYAYFRLGEQLTAEGQRIPVGRMTVGGGHADPRVGFRAAVEHYDNAGATAALVAAGEDAHGIWVAGALSSHLTPEQEQQFRTHPPSGDWRRVNGSLELMGVLSVVMPGFPVPRPKLAAVGGVQASLVAAGVLNPQAMQFADGARTMTASVADEIRAIMGRKRAADALAARIGRDPATRARELRARVHPGE